MIETNVTRSAQLTSSALAALRKAGPLCLHKRGGTVVAARPVRKAGQALGNLGMLAFHCEIRRSAALSRVEEHCRYNEEALQPKQQVCGVCLGLVHRTDICTQLKQSRRTACGAPGSAIEDDECTAHCVNCGGEHPATDSRCPARQRAPYDKEHVARYRRKKQQQQRTPPRATIHCLGEPWPELPSYHRKTPDSTIPTNVEEKEYDPSSSGPPPGHPSRTKTNAKPERNGNRRIPSYNANKAKTPAPTRSRSQKIHYKQQRRTDQQRRSTPLRLDTRAHTDLRRKSPQPEQNPLLLIDTQSERDHDETRRMHLYHRPQQQPNRTSHQTPHCNQPKIPINTIDSSPNSRSSQTRTTNNANTTRVWQWNCQEYRRKRSSLTQFIATQEHKRNEVERQEVDCVPSRSGNAAFSQELADMKDKPRVCTLEAKHIPAIVHALNVLDDLFRDAICAAREKTDDLVMAAIKGRRLMNAVDVLWLSLLNEPDQPDRIGNSASRDTCPELALVRTHDECTWTNLGESLRSDHLTLETQVPVALNRKRGQLQRLVNWDAFRQISTTTPTTDRAINDDEALDQWVQRLQADVERATKKYPHEDGYTPHVLDADVTEQEVRNALQNTSRSNAPGKDGWWKQGVITLRHKPGKPLSLQNLRPIFLTSCISKLMEHVVLRRLQPHLRAFSQPLCSASGRTCPPRMSSYSLKKTWTYDYVRLFLADRTATLGLGDQRSDLIPLTGMGPSKSSVLLPTRFNIAMAGLLAIPRIHHTFYANDITVWIKSGSDDEAAEATQRYARAAGLSCSVDKLELLLIRDTAQTKINEKIEVSIEGQPVPIVKRLRILGLLLQRDGKATFTAQILRRQCRQIAHLIRRVTNSHRGLKESDTLRIVQALLVRRVVYHAPFHNFRRCEVEALDATLRTSVKTAELVEAQQTWQRTRFGHPTTGRALLRRLCYRVPTTLLEEVRQKPAPSTFAAKVRLMPIPKKMHPQAHAGRRLARVCYLRIRYHHDPDALYRDMAPRAGPGLEVCSPPEAKTFSPPFVTIGCARTERLRAAGHEQTNARLGTTPTAVQG
ncbi:hypothetical protein HPB47_006780 [Ixodes persulcatus]|uniref:Uncharacterized protein n=1 Tax=Ixodes persulcatus TaxID=34615 RepID=A0AC60PA94_IXOPE|nr:hypothetical protein HPB47_006780 [Ixodes persulcatus]